MYTNSAYIGEMHEDIVDTSKPILVTAAGYFRLEKTPVFVVLREIMDYLRFLHTMRPMFVYVQSR